MAILDQRESHLRENPFDLARRQLRKVADTFAVDDALVNVLQECKKSVEVAIPTRLDDGSVHTFTGYRVTHNVLAVPRRAASATTPTSRSTRSRRSRWR